MLMVCLNKNQDIIKVLSNVDLKFKQHGRHVSTFTISEKDFTTMYEKTKSQGYEPSSLYQRVV